MNFKNRILHVSVPDDAPSLVTWLANDFPNISDLLQFGAVYLDRKRLSQDQPITRNQYLRIHLQPRRFDSCIPSTPIPIVQSHSDWLIALKPAGLPTHATLDNRHENLLSVLQEQLGCPIFLTHRLDQFASGSVIFARSRLAQTKFNCLFRRKQIQKMYLTVTERPLPLGIHIHFINPDAMPPRPITTQFTSRWWRCELKVLASLEYSPGLFANEIQLITGHTHQIRAQCAALGAPLLGDTFYGSRSKNPKIWPAQTSRLETPYRSSLYCSGLKFV